MPLWFTSNSFWYPLIYVYRVAIVQSPSSCGFIILIQFFYWDIFFLNFTNMDNLDCLIKFNAGVIYLSLDLGTLQLTRGNYVFTQIDLRISHIFTPVEQASYICTAKIKINFLLSFIVKIYYQKRRIFLSKKKNHTSYFILQRSKKKFLNLHL